MSSARSHSSCRSPIRYQRNLAAWGMLSAVVLLGVMAGPFFLGRIYTRDDLGGFHLPTRQFYAGQLARGEPFDWMPQLFAGFDLTGEGQVGGYHPLHWLLYRTLRLEAALAVECLASYPLMLLGTYWLLRRRRFRRSSAMFGAIAFTFGGFNLLHFVHPNAVAIVAHIPWLLGAIDRIVLDDRRRWMPAAAIALLTGSQLLLGYPQYVWFSLLIEAAYLAWTLCNAKQPSHNHSPLPLAGEGLGVRAGGIQSPSTSWTGASRKAPLLPCLVLIAAAKLLGLLMGAVQLLPTAVALQHSVRQSVDASFVNSGALHPLNLLQLIAPYLFAGRVVGGNTHESGLYIGAVPLVLLVWLRYRRAGLGSWRPLALACAAFAAAGFLLAMGPTGLFYRLQQYLPLVGGFRCPCRYLLLCHLATSVLAAIAFTLLARQLARGEISSWEEIKPLAVVTAASVVAAGVGGLSQFLCTKMGLSPSALLATPQQAAIGPLLVAAAAALVTLAARGRRWALPAMIVFTAADLGVYGCSYAFYPDTARLADYIASVPQPPGPGSVRLAADLLPPFDPAPHQGNQFVLTGWRRVDGYAGLEPRRSLDYRQLAALQAADVGWVLPTDVPRRITGLLTHASGWLQVPGPLSRVRLVARAKLSDHPAADLEKIDGKTTALVDRPVALDPGDPGRVTLLADRPGHLEMQVDCPGRQLLVIAESYHSGWQATLAGRPRPLLRANGDFLGCVVGPGSQRVLLEFRPASLQLGKWLSLLGLAMTGMIISLGFKNK